MDEWQMEARKLEMQGKKEQAEEIRRSILEITEPDWEPITPDNREDLREQALDPDYFNKKAKDLLFAYALMYDDIESIMDLSDLKYRRADRYESEKGSVLRKYYSEYISDNVQAVEQNIRKYGVDYRDQFNMTPLMAAVQSGSMKILELLTACGANASLTDNLGKNAFQISLYHSWSSPGYLRKLDRICTYLLTDNIKISVDDCLIKIDSHKIEYFLLNFFIALQHLIVYEDHDFFLAPKGVKAGDLEKAVEDYPEIMLPEYRKKRTYLSANLSKHEAGSSNPYNKKLFLRLYRGYYVLNPGLAVWVNEKWVKVYELMNTEEVRVPAPDERKTWLRNYWNLLQKERARRHGRMGYYDEDDNYDWLDDEVDLENYYDMDDEEEDFTRQDNKPENETVDIDAVIEKYYDELFDGDSDSEEKFRKKLNRVILKERMENFEMQLEKYGSYRNTGDVPDHKDTRDEGNDAGQKYADTGQEEKDPGKDKTDPGREETDDGHENMPQQEQKHEATQFRLPFDD